jgi:hypothetical protein
MVHSTDPIPTNDLICIGFGPISLAMAVLLYDALEAGILAKAHNVLFLEKDHAVKYQPGLDIESNLKIDHSLTSALYTNDGISVSNVKCALATLRSQGGVMSQGHHCMISHLTRFLATTMSRTSASQPQMLNQVMPHLS